MSPTDSVASTMPRELLPPSTRAPPEQYRTTLTVLVWLEPTPSQGPGADHSVAGLNASAACRLRASGSRARWCHRWAGNGRPAHRRNSPKRSWQSANRSPSAPRPSAMLVSGITTVRQASSRNRQPRSRPGSPKVLHSRRASIASSNSSKTARSRSCSIPPQQRSQLPTGFTTTRLAGAARRQHGGQAGDGNHFPNPLGWIDHLQVAADRASSL